LSYATASVRNAVGLVLLLVMADFTWITLLFPMRVLLVSTYILVADFRREVQAATVANRGLLK
jgi:hypothetical protein